jgi:hypothetical protein
MFEFAAFGFVTLVWWTWPAIAGIVFGSMWAALWLHDLKQKREDKASGPYPCGYYMGTDISGQVDHWCWQRESHAGEHVNQWGVPLSDFEAEGEEELPPRVNPDSRGPLREETDYGYEPYAGTGFYDE